jgi:hypothetical protein
MHSQVPFLFSTNSLFAKARCAGLPNSDCRNMWPPCCLQQSLSAIALRLFAFVTASVVTGSSWKARLTTAPPKVMPRHRVWRSGLAAGVRRSLTIRPAARRGVSELGPLRCSRGPAARVGRGVPARGLGCPTEGLRRSGMSYRRCCAGAGRGR